VKACGEVPDLLAGQGDLLGEQADVVGIGEHLLERQPGVVEPPARASASTYMNEQRENGALRTLQAVRATRRVVR
jgi:hypothetical protein